MQHDTPSEITLPLPFHFNLHTFEAGEARKHIDMCFLIQAKTDRLTDNPDGATEIGWYTLEEIRDKHSRGEMFNPTLETCEWVFARKLNTTTR